MLLEFFYLFRRKFDAGKRGKESLTIDAAYVDAKLKDLAASEDLARYVL